jgi:hypothetical protein
MPEPEVQAFYAYKLYVNYLSPLMYKAKLLFKLEALFEWITLVFANLSNIADTFGIKPSASFLEVKDLSLRTAFLVVL